MFAQVDNSDFTIKQRWILTILILILVISGSIDVFTDLIDGARLSHLLAEGFSIGIGTIGIIWIWFQNQRLKSSGKNLTIRLDAARKDAKHWRQKADKYIAGLSQSIADQFDFWKLSSAEKEVGWLLLKGMALKEISSIRGTSERTSRQQAQEVYRKSNLNGRAEFAAFFLEDLLIMPKQIKQE